MLELEKQTIPTILGAKTMRKFHFLLYAFRYFPKCSNMYIHTYTYAYFTKKDNICNMIFIFSSTLL